ncbi:MAG: Ig-like domain-containing protein [Edaphobacter sp.]
MKCTRFISLFAGLILAGNLSCLATAQSAGTSNAAQNTGNVTNSISITAQPGGDGVSQTIALKLPVGAESGTITVVLNGKNVTANFASSSCPGAVCETGILSAVDGIQSGKNTLYATAKLDGGKVASSRIRFVSGSSPRLVSAVRSSVARPQPRDQSGTVSTSYLPPSVAFITKTPGGYQSGQPWIQIGLQTYPTNPSSFSCAANSTNQHQYVAIVLDRQTLVEQTSLQVSGGRAASPFCAESSGDLSNNLLAGLPQSGNYLVIVGSIFQQNADYNLDTTLIGGTKYLNYPTATQPQGYMAIGVLGAQGGAYENYYTNSSSNPNPLAEVPMATGMLVEDMNGNYNFESSDAIEYTVSPNDPSYPNQSIAKVAIPPSQQTGGVTTNIYTSGVQGANGQGGYWLLVLQREDLESNPNCSGTVSGSTRVFTGCGTFYPTGSSTGSTATSAYTALASALNGVHPDQLAILTTVGNAAYSSSTTNQAYDVANTMTSATGFTQALTNLGAPSFDPLFLYPQNPVQTYTYVTAPGLGNPLSGMSVLSTSLYAQQAQTGYVHGILVRNTNGLYRPGATSQEIATNDTADFTIGLVTSQQPVDWPGLSQSSPDPGLWGAYNYISYLLINYKYLLGSQGSYRDDIHYYYNGSLNTSLDYHVSDPLYLPFPTGSNGLGTDLNCSASTSTSCTWTDPVSGQSVTFSLSDFQTMAVQLHIELIYLYNTLQYMVDGSTNMKDIVASGSSNTALALIGAASTVEASTLQPKSTSQIKLQVGNILGMVYTAFRVSLLAGSDGAVDIPDQGSNISKVLDHVGDMMSNSSTLGGGITHGRIPNADFSYLTTIGDLANTDLQGQMSAGFDAALDSILSDWNKLSQIGPLVTNTNQGGFYTSTQSTQIAAVGLINQGTQRSIYLSLLPVKYEIHYWPGVYSGVMNGDGNNQPDMGWFQYNKGNPNDCGMFYTQPPPQYAAVWAPTLSGGPTPFPNDTSNPSTIQNINYWVMALPFQNSGDTDASASYADTTIINTLFSNQSGGLNIPFNAFVAPGGPMNNPPVAVPATTFSYTDMSQISSSNNKYFSGYSIKSICSGKQNQDEGGNTFPSAPHSVNDSDSSISSTNASATSAPPTNPNVIDSTSVTLVAPSSSVSGGNVTLQATVVDVTNTNATPAGTIRFKDGTTPLGDVTTDAKGNATLSISSLALGAHSLTATYLTDGVTYNTSASAVSTLTVYSNSPDMTLSLSASTLSVSYGSASPAVTMQVTSQAGLAGDVTFACSGLPVGMTCNFTPSSATIASGANVTTSFTITGNAVPQTAGLYWKGGIGTMLCAVSLMFLGSIRSRKRSVPALLCLMLLTVAAFNVLTGCNGSPAPSPALKDSGTRTVMVSATSSSVTRETPLTVTIQ